MENFAAIDFETANEQRTSVCSVGVVIVRNGEIADSYYSLIRPELFSGVALVVLSKVHNRSIILIGIPVCTA